MNIDDYNEATRAEHDKLQSQYFDERTHFFQTPIPEDIQERTRQIVKSANLSCKSKVLDVGCGLGVLFEHFQKEGVPESNIRGCDLSANMILEAKKRFPEAELVHCDIIDFPITEQKFQAIFFNACFGNIYDQSKALQRSTQLLSDSGSIIISHPLGAHFVANLHNQEPEIVPHLLPDKENLEKLCQACNLKVTLFVNEPDLYIVRLEKRN